jgi:hypothetical protein
MTNGAGAVAGAADVTRLTHPRARPGAEATVEPMAAVATVAVLRTQAEADRAATHTVMAEERAMTRPGRVLAAVEVTIPTVETGVVLAVVKVAAEAAAATRRAKAMEVEARAKNGAKRGEHSPTREKPG